MYAPLMYRMGIGTFYGLLRSERNGIVKFFKGSERAGNLTSSHLVPLHATRSPAVF